MRLAELCRAASHRKFEACPDIVQNVMSYMSCTAEEAIGLFVESSRETVKNRLKTREVSLSIALGTVCHRSIGSLIGGLPFPAEVVVHHSRKKSKALYSGSLGK